MENIAEAETSIETILREKHDILLEKIEREAGSLGSDCEYSITDDFSDRIIYERRGCHGLENQCHPAEGNRTTGRFRCHRARGMRFRGIVQRFKIEHGNCHHKSGADP